MSSKVTPLMQQYFSMKQQYDDALLLFQVGDFYELFFEDAKIVAQELGMALTKRGKHQGEPIPLCGFPVHAVSHHTGKLVKAGHKVAICDQVEEAVPGKTVKRAVTSVMTPGTLTQEHLLDEKRSSYLLSFFPHPDGWGLLFSELVSLQAFATVIKPEFRFLEAELFRFYPDEVVLAKGYGASTFAPWFKKHGCYTSVHQAALKDEQAQREVRLWMQQSLDDQGKAAADHAPIKDALSSWYWYIKKNQQHVLQHTTKLQWYQPEQFLLLDSHTLQNLDILENRVTGHKKHSLFHFMDRACSPMGSRMLKRWLVRPLLDRSAIRVRQDAVSTIMAQPLALKELEGALSGIADFERTVGRVALDKAPVHEYRSLAEKLAYIQTIGSVVRTMFVNQDDGWQILQTNTQDLQKVLQAAFDHDPDQETNHIIKTGFDQELDHMRELLENSNQKVLQLERKEQEQTGIPSLKIRSNNVHGYYIEVTKTHTSKVPDHYIRQQTLVAKERYTTEYLQAFQFEVMQAQKQYQQKEQALFAHIKEKIRAWVPVFRHIAYVLGECDALVGLARLALQGGYCKPEITEGRDILISQGKHPILADQLRAAFVPNDTVLSDQQSTWIITGPNMGGKSTYLRQVALLCLMAQVGSFVPAQSAQLPVLDRIFTRIGAGDNLAEGKSTFLVEMEETAHICRYATNRSLVVLDEVGRGTSTFDGLAIAQAVVEYIHTQIGARCLFATHYHELTELVRQVEGIASYFAASKTTDKGIVLLHTIVKGVADGSFGIHVAQQADLPKAVIAKAVQHLARMKQQDHTKTHTAAQQTFIPSQPVLSDNQQKVMRDLQAIDVDTLTPRQALQVLWEVKDVLG